MTQEPSNNPFPSTAWSQLTHDQTTQSDHPGITNMLYEQYWSAVYAYLRRSGYDRELAGEYTQSFFVEVVIGRGLFARANRTRGRLRSLILTALKNYLIDQARKNRAYNKSCLNRTNHTTPSSVPHGTAAEQEFNHRWASAALQETLTRLESYYRDHGRLEHWTAFELRIVRPMTGTSTRPTLGEITALINAKNNAETSAMIQTTRRRCISILREVIAETVADEDELEDELSILLNALRVY